MNENPNKASGWKVNLIIILTILALVIGGVGVYGVWRLGDRFKEAEISADAEIETTATAAPEVTETPIATETPEATAAPTVTPEATAAPTITPEAAAAPTVTPETTAPPEVTATPKPTEVPRTNKRKVAIDAGHQQKGNSSEEPIGPGASKTKAKVSSGTQGVETKIPEYVLNLEVSMKLKQELISRGYEVSMIRESHEVNISNSERAKMAADAGADVFVRIHANGDNNSSVRGALTMAPDAKNPYMDGTLIKNSQKLSQEVINAYCKATGAKNRGVMKTNGMSGINWCTIPVTIVEMGFMTNPQEDVLMQEDEYQKKIVKGIADGIDSYFKEG